MPEIFRKFPVLLGDRFVSDCTHHHPVLPNRRFPGRVKTGRFCGDFRRYRSALSISGDICGLSGRFEPPVSASKNSVPRGRAATAQYPWVAAESWEFLEPKRTFRARPVFIADSIRGLRTAGSILPAHREVARLQCRGANDLGPQRARGLARETQVRSSC